MNTVTLYMWSWIIGEIHFTDRKQTYHKIHRGWSGGAMVLGNLPVPGCPTNLITVGQGPIALAVGAVGVVWTFLLSSILSLLSPSLWETARYRLKHCLKGPLNPKQPTNRHKIHQGPGIIP